MSEDRSGSWRDEREHQGLDRALESEDESEVPYPQTDEGQRKLLDQEMSTEDISRLLTDGSPEEQEPDQETRIESDAWAAYHISRGLQEHYEETGEYWVLEVNEGQIDPVFVVRDDKIVTHPDYDVENDFQWEIDGEESNGHPFAILSYTGEEQLFMGHDFKTAELPVPRVDGQKLEEVEQYDRINDTYLAPGLTEDYRDAAEELIDMFYEE